MILNKKTARIAGVLYLFMGIIAAHAIIYVPSKIMAPGNDTATTNNILANEFLFRTGIVSMLVSSVMFVFLVLALYQLLKNVNGYQAKLMAAFVLVQVPISFLIEIFNISSLMILKGEIMKALEPEQKQVVAMLFLNFHKYGMIILEIFWGLWLIPFGQLVYKSGFIPRIFGLLLILGGMGYIIESFTFLLFPDYHTNITKYTSVTYSVGEISIILWLLIKGVKVKNLQDAFEKA